MDTSYLQNLRLRQRIAIFGAFGISAIIFASILFISYKRDDITQDFFVELMSALAGLILGLATQHFLHLISTKDEQKSKKEELIANFYEHLKEIESVKESESGKESEYPLAQHLKRYHEWRNKSGQAGRESPLVIAKLLERTTNAAQDRWTEAFNLLASCPEFHGAWDVFLVLRKDIKDSVQSTTKLVSEIGGNNGNNDGAGHTNEINQSDWLHLKTALRNLESALHRRDESFIDIPSLQTMVSSSRKDKDGPDLSTMLSEFWPLFNIASMDIRMAYLRLLTLYEKYEEKYEKKIDMNIEGGTWHDVKLINRTMLAALERIRNCIVILKNGGGSQESANQDIESSLNDHYGNTVISRKHRELLVRDAKKLEGGRTQDVDSDSKEIYRTVLPANFGVMIRDIDTACKVLEKIKGVKEEDPDKNLL